MSKLQQLAQRKSGKAGGISRLLGSQRSKLTFRQTSPEIESITPIPSIEQDQIPINNDLSPSPPQFTWSLDLPITNRILNNVPDHQIPQTWFQTGFDLKKRKQEQPFFTNNPITVSKPKKKKSSSKQQQQVTEEEQVDSKMAKLTLVPKKPKTPVIKSINEDILKSKSDTPTLSFITIGHVDSGKSTTLGRFLYDVNVISSRQLNTLAKQAKDAGKGSFSLAWIMDQTPEERSRGVTVDTVQCGLEIDGRKLVLVDSPGHQDYLPSVVNGVIGADVAVVIVDSSNDLIFNLSSNNADSIIHTREQLRIAKSLGITKLLVLVNKLDTPSYEDSQLKFETIVNAIKDTLLDSPPHGFGFDRDFLEFVPISGINGDNIVKKSENMQWYQGKTMLNVLESWWDIKKLQVDINVKDPFIFNITDVINSNMDNTAVSKVKDNEVVAFGRVHSGYIQQGDILIDSWGGERGQVDGIWSQQSLIGDDSTKVDERLSEKVASKGDFIELKLKKVGTPQNITIGDVLTKDQPGIIAQTVNDFIIDITTFDLDRPLLVGSPIVVFRGGRAYDGKIQSIEFVVTKSPTSGKLIKKKNRNHLGSNQRAQIHVYIGSGMGVVLINDELTVMDKLNRIVLRKDAQSVAGGVIKNIKL